ncbi:MAG: VanZ family protein [Polaromonas sp.]|jgi:VanZ family protein|nr:VanZ family protein [Polaromonas sp.]
MCVKAFSRNRRQCHCIHTSAVFHPRACLRWLAAATVLAVSAGLFVGGALPVAVGLFTPPWDLLAHASVFTVIGVTSGVASGARGWHLLMFCLVGAVAVGAMDELHQLRLPGRSADLNDLAADAVGGLLGSFLLGSAYRWVDGKPWADRWRPAR